MILMKKNLLFLYTSITLLALPMIVFGGISPLPQPNFGSNPIDFGLIFTTSIFNFIWPIFGSIAILILIFSGFLFLTANGEPTKVSTARKALLWGIVGIAIALLSSTIPFIIKQAVGL